jgi:hypothetical protein
MCQKWLQSVGWRRPHKQMKYNLKKFFYYTLPYLNLPFFLVQQKRLNRFARTMTQTTRFAVRKCLLGVALIGNYILGSKPPENPKFWNRDAKFPALTCYGGSTHKRLLNESSRPYMLAYYLFLYVLLLCIGEAITVSISFNLMSARENIML